MKIKKIISIIAALSFAISSMSNAIACTTLLIFDTKGNAYHGRTMEFSYLIPTSMTYFPTGSKVESMTPAGKQGKTFNTKYAFISMSMPVVENAKQPTVAEGANDQGLSFSANVLNNSSGPSIGNDPAKILSVADLGAWILGSFKNVDEVKAAMQSDDTEFWLPPIPVLGNALVPLHYAIFDKKGGALVIEFANNKKNVYDNPAYVMTNGPELPWHLENLSNYTFTNKDKNTGQLGKLKLSTQDAGIALTGLPSAQTSQGRFVKAAFYANYVRKAENPDDAVTTLAHIMNNFDRPYDLTVDGAGGTGDGPRSKSLSSEITAWTVLNDLSRNLFYVRSINAMNWSVIDLNKLKDVKQIKTVSTYDINKAGADAYSVFYK